MINYGKIEGSELQPDPREAAARLQVSRGFENGLTADCLKELRAVLDCKFSWTRCCVRRTESKLDLGFGEFESEDLRKNLQDCDEAFVFAVTLGLGVDRLLIRESLMSESRHFVTDALASALAEAACDEAEERVKGRLRCKPRFSPGYGDLPLHIQPQILSMINGKALGITLSSSLLMTPSKSITAIMGIINEQ